MRTAIVNINLAVEVPDNATREEVQKIIENFELPHGYVEDSFEYVGTFDEDKMEYVDLK